MSTPENRSNDQEGRSSQEQKWNNPENPSMSNERDANNKNPIDSTTAEDTFRAAGDSRYDNALKEADKSRDIYESKGRTAEDFEKRSIEQIQLANEPTIENEANGTWNNSAETNQNQFTSEESTNTGFENPTTNEFPQYADTKIKHEPHSFDTDESVTNTDQDDTDTEV